MAKDGLSIWYRIGWNIRRFVFGVFGPAQQLGQSDPLQRLHQEREEKILQAKAKQARG